VSLNDGGQSEQFLAEVVSGNYFSALGLRAERGRLLSAEDDRAGAEPVAVVGDLVWRRFGVDPPLIGKVLTLNGKTFTVVGVAPQGYSGIGAGIGVDIWVPVNQAAPWLAPDMFTNRRTGRVQVLGRLQPGVSLTQAQAAMTARAQELQQAYPEANVGMGVLLDRARYLDNSLRGAITAFLGIIIALVGLLLLTVCANLTNLLLVRTAGRRREMVMRWALGASRVRLVRQLLTESLLLVLAGGVAGTLLGIWSASLLTRFNPLPATIPLRFDLSPDIRVLGFALCASLLTGLILGLIPAVQASRANVASDLKEGGGSLGSLHKSRLRNAFVISQVAVSMVLLIGAGLFLRSLWQTRAINIGFDPNNAVALDVDLKPRGFSEERGQRFYREMLRRMTALPEVRSATLSDLAPLDTATPFSEILIEGQEPLAGEHGIRVSFNRVGPAYFETIGIALRSGRGFDERDDANRTRVAVVNETMAQRFWPSQDPIGKTFRLLRGNETPRFFEIVGVAREVKYRSLGEEPTPHFYVPFLQDYSPGMTLIVRISSDAGAALATIQRELQSQDRDVQGFFARTLIQHIGLAMLPARLAANFAGIFGGFALVLTALGIYGVVSHSSSHRTREIGLRMALGAQPAEVLSLILIQGGKLFGIGIAIGLAGALGVTRFLAGLLYGISPADPPTFTAVTILLAAVALVACYIPAQRAMKVDPIVALRYE
jgi:predicted permease